MDGNLPDWLKDTTASKQAPPPPVAEEPELLPAPSPKVLIKPALVAVLIILVIAASGLAFFLVQQRKAKFVVPKKAEEVAKLPAIVCPEPRYKSSKIVKESCPSGKLNCPQGAKVITDKGFSLTYGCSVGVGSSAPSCPGAGGEKQTYSVEAIKCTDSTTDPQRCTYYRDVKRSAKDCKTLELDSAGVGSFSWSVDLPECGLYQVDICPAGDNNENCFGQNGGVVFGFRVDRTTNCCPYDLSIIGLNQTASAGSKLPTIYAQSNVSLTSPTIVVTKPGGEQVTLAIQGAAENTAGKYNHKFVYPDLLVAGTYTFELKVGDGLFKCTERTLAVSGGATGTPCPGKIQGRIYYDRSDQADFRVSDTENFSPVSFRVDYAPASGQMVMNGGNKACSDSCSPSCAANFVNGSFATGSINPGTYALRLYLNNANWVVTEAYLANGLACKANKLASVSVSGLNTQTGYVSGVNIGNCETKDIWFGVRPKSVPTETATPTPTGTVIPTSTLTPGPTNTPPPGPTNTPVPTSTPQPRFFQPTATPTEAMLPEAGIKIPTLGGIIMGFLLISLGMVLVF